MKTRPRSAATDSAARQRGVVLLMVAVLLGIAAASVLAMSRLGESQQAAAQLHNAAVLTQARAALLGRAVADAERPGSLPCPDTDNDGNAQLLAGSQCPAYIGRLPWRTLELPDLRDAAGERLWYALSPSLRDDDSAEPINSDTPGNLSVSGPGAARDVAAIVFAPGAALGGQSRDAAGVNQVANYLEGDNGNAFDSSFETAAPGSAFNDQLSIITQRRLFALVETAVARRIESEIKPLLAAHRAAWVNFPFAKPFVNPDLSATLSLEHPQFLGVQNTPRGLLPVAHAWYTLAWDAAGSTATRIGGSGTVSGTVCTTGAARIAPSCGCTNDDADPCGRFPATPTPAVPPTLQCTITYSGSPRVRVDAKLTGAGRAFSTLAAGDINPPSLANRSLTGALANDANASGTLRLSADLPATPISPSPPWWCWWCPPPGPMTTNLVVDIPMPCPSPVSSAASGSPLRWFTRNRWYRLLYYAADSSVLPGGLGVCTAPCLTVNGLTPADDKGALLVLAGKALDSQRSRPIAGSATESDYFEGQNLSPDGVFETQRRGAGFNDRVVILDP